ncbi:mechanosensitive ion channel family protein [Corynebacterium anserum]|uniref:Mechanosensitive ion channel n=1 Tax=Corynebacterium anserum TaxID=2684406 RepID=A0A7G7YP21_9CORY|nr:mechanosensitive ion channel domain-containing protein [Corynebacterium anserum]QNH96241.1 mechanosensitive ion channel [Corynebacterium anserum]
MLNVDYFLLRLWEWLIRNGLPIAALLIVAVLIPRVGRLAVRIVTQRFSKEEEATKTRLALIGATVYVLEAIAYFFVIMLILTKLGVPPMGAAIPATVVSAAVGFGAQNVIGDFLAGFFIISERQFGLGDYVGFDGPSKPVEGTVVALTLRSTRLRTPSGEMVNIPNGSTGVITNFSQEWSRAVVDIQIPMNSGESMADLTRKVEAAAEEAVKDPEVAKDITDDLDVLPATKLIQPTTAGQPWSVQYRITVDVNPARQWAVERAIRAAIANVFWDRMQVARGFAPLNPDGTSAHHGDLPHGSNGQHSDSDTLEAATELMPSVVASTKKTELNQSIRSHGSHSSMTATDDGPGAPAFKGGAHSADGSTSNQPGHHDEEALEEETINGWFDRHEYDTKLKNILSVGGRTRVSTTLLLLGLLLIGGLALASSNPDGGNAGMLNPAYWNERTNGQKTTQPSTEPSEVTKDVQETTGNAEQTANSTETNDQQGKASSTAPQTASSHSDTSAPTTPHQSESHNAPRQTPSSGGVTDTTGNSVDTHASAPLKEAESAINSARR